MIIALGMGTSGSPFPPEDTVLLRQSWNKRSAGEGRDEFMVLPHTSICTQAVRPLVVIKGN